MVHLLSNLRQASDRIMVRICVLASKTGLSAGAWTLIGLGFAILSGLTYSNILAHASALAGLLLLLSGFTDMVDGGVARATNSVSVKGAFLDSTLDRVGEVFVFAGLLVGNSENQLVVFFALAFSLTVSYTRSRGESLGVKVEGVGIGERADRLLALAVLSIIGYPWIGATIVLALASITLVQRFFYILSKLPGKQTS